MEPGYPAARRSDVTDILNGVRVPDPYRWLEDAGSQETGEWLAGQDALYAAYPDGRARAGGVAGGGAGKEHAVLFTADGDGPEQVLIDPVQINPDGTTTLDGWQPDKEGRLLAYQLS